MDIKHIIDNKLFIGTLKKRANPKTEKYWAYVYERLVLINPEVILDQLQRAAKKIKKYLEEGRDILVLHDKLLYKKELEELCEKRGVHYFSYKVPSGVITNFETLFKNINKMNEMKKFIESDDFQRLTKKERLVRMRQLKKIENIYKGVKNMEKKPDVVIIIDGKCLKKFVYEVEISDIDNVVIANTDFDKWWPEENLIIANTNSYESLDFILKTLLT